MRKILMILVTLMATLTVFSMTAFAADNSSDSIQPLRYGIGVGFESVPNSTGYVNAISVESDFLSNKSTELLSRIRVGGVFGFNTNFYNVVLGPKAQYFILQSKNFGLFTEAAAYFSRMSTYATQNGFGINALAGFEFSVPSIEDLKIGLSYGLVMDYFGNNDKYGQDNLTIGIANSSVIGNLQIHYFF